MIHDVHRIVQGYLQNFSFKTAPSISPNALEQEYTGQASEMASNDQAFSTTIS